MKTSNKLLLLLVALLYVIPLFSIVLDLKHYRPLTERKSSKDLALNKFSDSLTSYTSFKMESAYKNVEIVNGRNMHFVISFHQEATAGVKIPDDLKNEMKVFVNGAGTLIIEMLKNTASKHILVQLYGPTIQQLQASLLEGLTLEGRQDSLSVVAQGINELLMGNLLQVDHLKLSAESVKSVNLYRTSAKNANIELKNSTMEYWGLDLNSLKLRVERSEVQMQERYDTKAPSIIRTMELESLGNNRLDLNEVRLDRVTGSLSDSTMVYMPVRHLRGLLK